MRAMVLWSVLCLSVCAQPNPTACSLSVEMEREFSALPSMSDLSLSWDQRYAPRRDLAKRYPQDWSLQFKLQQPILQHSELRREWDLALAHYRALSDRQLGELLEARLLSPLYPKKSREVIERVLAEAPDSPWSTVVAINDKNQIAA